MAEENAALRALEVAAETRGIADSNRQHLDHLHDTIRQDVAALRDRATAMDVSIKQIFRQIYGDPLTVNSPSISKELDNLTLKHAALQRDLSRIEVAMTEANNLFGQELTCLRDAHQSLKNDLRATLLLTSFVSFLLNRLGDWLKTGTFRWALFRALPIGTGLSLIFEWLRATGVIP